nr:reverse transcriptase domain-containing protein [Tanacetum cinerariifolium]
MDVKGAPECMQISVFVHGITNPELIKRLYDKIPKIVDEMLRVTTSFLRRGSGSLESRAKEIVSTMETARGNHFTTLDEEEGTEGPMIIDVEIGGHCIHRMENTTAGKDWRRRTLRFGLDEFRGAKVTISVQWNYWKTRIQETASSSVNSSRNVKDPGRMRSNYPKRQQVGPIGMCVGLQTRRDPPGY